MQRRSLTAALTIALALLGGVVAAPAQAATFTDSVTTASSPPSTDSLCSAGWYFRNTGRGANSHSKVGNTQSNYNGTGSSALMTLTATTSGTASTTVSGSQNIGLSVEVASIANTYGISATVSKTVTLGNQFQITVPAYKTGNGNYGAWRAYTTGVEEYNTAACAVTSTVNKTFYTPYQVGWNTWIS